MDLTLVARTGRKLGSAESRRLRRQGKVPAVVYGHGLDPLAVEVDHRELMAVLHTEAGLNAIITLQVDEGANYTTLAREVQRHPYKPLINHLDFVQISLTEVVQATVGIEFVGEAVGVRESGGIVEAINATVEIEALPMEIPQQIEVDVSALDVGDTLTIADLPQIAGVTYLDDPDTPIVTISIPSAVLAEEGEEAAEGEGVEGEGVEGEAAEGDGADGGEDGGDAE